MGRRIEIELTSQRDDGSWTWRAAGAKQPKGDVDGALLYSGAAAGDVVKADATFHIDGIEITEVHPPKQKQERTDLLEMKSRPVRDDELVTTQRVARRGGDRRRDRGGRGDRDDRGGGSGRGPGRGRNERRSTKPPSRPKPKRLRPRREHRDALLASVAEEHRPIVEQVIRDGMPGVRAAIDRQNKEAKAEGKPEIEAAPVLAIAESNLAKARLAEWRDRADAALADSGELDLRDLRSVVVVGTDIARDDESKAIADQLKTVLDDRMESDHAAWLEDLRVAIGDGRTVRALRLSSRPVKAGAPLPTDLATELSAQTARALADDTPADRWAIVLDALAFSPVRAAVTPLGVPAEPAAELVAEVRRLSDRLPTIAGLFGIDPASVPKSERRRRSPRSRRDEGKGKGKGQSKSGSKKDSSEPKAKAESKPSETTTEQAPSTAADPSTAPVETPAIDAVTAEVAQAEPTEAPVATEAESEAVTPATDAVTAEVAQAEPTEASGAVSTEEPVSDTGATSEEAKPASEPAQPVAGSDATDSEATPETEVANDGAAESANGAAADVGDQAIEAEAEAGI